MVMHTELYQRKRDFEIWGLVGICATTRDEFVREAFSMPTSPESATIDLVGVPALISSKKDPELSEVYNSATMAAIDGMPIVKMARRRGFDCERCAAPDVMGLMFEESVKQGKTHYFYGGKDEQVLSKLRENLERSYPGINIVGMYSPPFRDLTQEEDAALCDEINSLKPDFLWVGIGAPKQEKWMHAHRGAIHNTVMLGVGAGFNFFAGTLSKAPAWVEKLGLEWLFRLFKEPRRLWKRYIIGGFKYVYYSATYRLFGKKKNKGMTD